MKIEDIFSEWTKDCKIDTTQLDVESLNTPQLHNKYIRLYAIERVHLKKMQGEYNNIRRKLVIYYRGEAMREDLIELGGRPQFLGKAMAKELDILVETDDMLQGVLLKLSVQEEKVDFLKAAISAINKRSFEIKNAIDWQKWTQGAT